MKYNKIILTIFICSVLVFVVSCGGTTGRPAIRQNNAASSGAVSGSVLSEGQAEQRTDIADIEAQLKLIVEKRDKWLLTWDEDAFNDYSVTDFDQNGKLEICRSEYEEDMGYRNTFWEVNEQNDDLMEIRLEKKNKSGYLIDTDDGYGIGYYDQDTDTWHYIYPQEPWRWLIGENRDDFSDMTKSEEKIEGCSRSDAQTILAEKRTFYYRIEWSDLGKDDGSWRRQLSEDELYQELMRLAKEFRIRYMDEMGEEVENPYFPYHEEEQTVPMQIFWQNHEGITGEMVYTIYKVAVGTEGTLYFINDTDIKNVIDTKTGKEKPRSWWGGQLDNRAREYLWVTKDEIYLVKDFHNVVNPGQNGFGKLLFENEICDTAVCICDQKGKSPELSLKRLHAWKKNVGWIGYRCYAEEWCNYKMQQKGYEPFKD